MMNAQQVDPAHQERLDSGQHCFQAALTYLQLGFSVVQLCDPLHVGVGKEHGKSCSSPGKCPMTPWKSLQTDHPSVYDLARWWKDYPIGNVGVVLGQVSGLVRLDVDGPAGEKLLQEWSGGDLPPTWSFRSSMHGRGLLYAWPRELPCKSLATAQPGTHAELRLMGNGSQTVMPPSRHHSGMVYMWEFGAGPDDGPLAPAPAWLRERLAAPPPREPPPPRGGTRPTAKQETIVSALAALDNAGDGVDYDTWLIVGMALHSTGESWGYDTWETWSQQSAKFNPGKQRTSWESFREHAHGVGIGTLYHYAKLAGWQMPGRPSLDADWPDPPDGPPDEPPGDDPPDPPDDGQGLLYSDAYNAWELIKAHGNAIRYCAEWETWLFWNGRCWERDTTKQLMRWCRQVVKQLGNKLSSMNDLDAKALMTHIRTSLQTARLDAAIRQAASWEGQTISAKVLDLDDWTLNVSNGSLNLRDGTLRPHRPSDLLTKCLDIPYHPDAPCPTWLTFLHRIMGGSQCPDTEDMTAADLEKRKTADNRAQTLIDYLQRCVGYTLSGSGREQCLFLLHGVTKTGKSTFLATLRSLLGVYGQQADMHTFMHKEKPEVRNDLADLAGARFVCAIESQEGQRLSENLVKQLTGGTDVIKARFLFQEHFSFRPTFKIYLASNHKPKIRRVDDALFERIKLIPFLVQIPKEERDKTLDDRIKAELPGVLAWAVQGALDWQAKGELQEPSVVLDATATYRSESDVIARYLDENCTVKVKEKDDRYKSEGKLLYADYQRWCHTVGEREETEQQFGIALTTMGIERLKSNGKVWRLYVGMHNVPPSDRGAQDEK